MSTDRRHAETLRVAIASCASACSALNDACAGALETAIARAGAPVQPGGELLMDCWYIASATARMLGRYGDYDPTNTAMQLSVCQHVAARAATSCDRTPGPLHALGAAAGTCAAACAIVLELIWDQAIDPVGAWDERNAPIDVDLEDLAPLDEDDEPVLAGADLRIPRLCAAATA